jgi:hypothetical protein
LDLDVYPDLSGANLAHAQLVGARLNVTNLNNADLRGADLSGSLMAGTQLVLAKLAGSTGTKANLWKASCRGADFQGANFSESDLRYANLTGANLTKANLSSAMLSQAMLLETDLTEATLKDADLQASILVRTKLSGANLNGCAAYGVSVWDVDLTGAHQNDLVISPIGEPLITVDNLKVAQFMFLLLRNSEIRDVVDTAGKKVVLLLGRFTPERKRILDTIKNRLRDSNFIPILFDFEKPESRDLSETVSLLARMAKFIIADITDAKSIPQELALIVPHLPSVPVQSLLQTSASEYSMFEHFSRYPWVLKTQRYDDEMEINTSFQEKVLAPVAEVTEMPKTTDRAT